MKQMNILSYWVFRCLLCSKGWLMQRRISFMGLICSQSPFPSLEDSGSLTAPFPRSLSPTGRLLFVCLGGQHTTSSQLLSFLKNFIYLFAFGYAESSLLCGLFSSCSRQYSPATVCRLSCPSAYGIFPDQGLNWWSPHCKANSQPQDHQGSPSSKLLPFFMSPFYYQVLWESGDFFWSLAEWSASSASSFEAVPQNGPPGATDQATFSPEHQSRSLSESRFEGLSAALSHTHSLPCPSPFILSEGFSDHLVFSHFYNCRHLQFSITCFPLAVSFTLGKWLTKTVSSPGLNFHRIILKV